MRHLTVGSDSEGNGVITLCGSIALLWEGTVEVKVTLGGFRTAGQVEWAQGVHCHWRTVL